MASNSSLEVPCSIHRATEPHAKDSSGLVPVHRREVVCSVGRKDKVLGSLCNWNAVRKAEALPGPPVQERTHRAKPPVKRHRWDSNPASLVYKTGALTRQATAPCCREHSLAAAEGWFGNQIACCPGAPLHPPFAFRSRKEKPCTPRWCSSTFQSHRWDSNPGSPVY